ncbi:DNA mismatch repair protein MutT [Arachidicoccus ginsenosidimutans]|uniref:NUDIX hydrolase n=1 Tax=Arachidicoccus sp. BS20 TaxID=1850526 RepID=UPI0007F073DE|nr:NUDIX domain-containing protein [Arachidicoccus sp. BS20]ANI90507.1 DNA mismatch repair protein MutT [Arachidicoccus sp. BS20]
MDTISLPTAGLVVVTENKLLLAYSKNKKAWYLPGGKIDKGETSLETLQREIYEELNIKLKTERLKYYCHITALAYGELPNIIMEQDCFIYDLSEKIKPNNEIEEVRFFNREMYQLEPAQVPGVLKIFDKLMKDKILL